MFNNLTVYQPCLYILPWKPRSRRCPGLSAGSVIRTGESKLSLLRKKALSTNVRLTRKGRSRIAVKPFQGDDPVMLSLKLRLVTTRDYVARWKLALLYALPIANSLRLGLLWGPQKKSQVKNLTITGPSPEEDQRTTQRTPHNRH